MTLRSIYSIILVLLFSLAVNAQDESSLVVVKLKDGSVLEGQLKEYKDGEYIKMSIGGSPITINFDSIKNIRHKNARYSKAYSFNEKGVYHHSSLAFLPGYQSPGESLLGMSLDHSSGYLFNRWIGAGLNFGVYNYNVGTREVIYALSAEARGYLLKRNLSPYYLFKAGYGYAHKGSSFLEADGGFFVNPSLGFRFNGNSGANLTAEIGLSFQKAYLKQQTDGWNRAILEKDLIYQRFNFKIGILF